MDGAPPNIELWEESRNLPERLVALLRDFEYAQVNSWGYEEKKDVARFVIEYKLDSKWDPLTRSTQDNATETSEVFAQSGCHDDDPADPSTPSDTIECIVPSAVCKQACEKRQEKQKTKPVSIGNPNNVLALPETCKTATIDTCDKQDRYLCGQLPCKMVAQDSNGAHLTGHEPEEVFRLSIPNSDLPSLSPSIGLYTRLRVLYLTGNKLQNLPRELAKLRNLELLRLGNNCFRLIPDVVYQLTELRSLDMSNNRLETQGITGNIKKLTKLESLVLNANEIRELNIGIFDLEHLIFLDASHNPISAIPKAVQKLKKLEYLRLKMCRLQALPEELGDLPRLETICVSENMISKVPAEKFQKMGQLRTICLHSNRLSVQEEALVKLRQLKDVRLGLNDEPVSQSLNACCGGCYKKPPMENDVLIIYSGTDDAKTVVDDEILPILEKELRFSAVVDFRDFIVGKPVFTQYADNRKSCRKILFVLTADFCSGLKEDENRMHLNEALLAVADDRKVHSHGHSGRHEEYSRIIPLIWNDDPNFQLPEELRIYAKLNRKDKYFWKKLQKALA
ncbi:leucine-rich repeat protein SHOC-2-like [Lingula anatina]|uniref:Leucine-rich repeat protein SHOC-2-like n=1 Tax=Lingula anatina TaxID=7574 RepID=A0A1S3IWE5_LINAN|nr:leucine-rich repeat protein SHOC-2-like [Lingula anatina]|eukprot:XP_013402510.1 leucine-rich repeat protein SHOC-2-like [Lingula anatina]